MWEEDPRPGVQPTVLADCTLSAHQTLPLHHAQHPRIRHSFSIVSEFRMESGLGAN